MSRHLHRGVAESGMTNAMTRFAKVVALCLVAWLAVSLPSRSSYADPRERCEPSRFALFGEDSYFTTRGSPGHVFFRVENRSIVALAVRLVRIVLVERARTTHIPIESVIDDATDTPLGRRFSLAVGERRRVRVHVDVPQREGSYLFRAAVADGLCTYEAESHVVFAHRTPLPVR